MRHKVQEYDNLLVWIHSLGNMFAWEHAIKMEQLETESFRSQTIYLQESQPKVCCNITEWNIVFWTCWYWRARSNGKK